GEGEGEGEGDTTVVPQLPVARQEEREVLGTEGGDEQHGIESRGQDASTSQVTSPPILTEGDTAAAVACGDKGLDDVTRVVLDRKTRLRRKCRALKEEEDLLHKSMQATLLASPSAALLSALAVLSQYYTPNNGQMQGMSRKGLEEENDGIGSKPRVAQACDIGEDRPEGISGLTGYRTIGDHASWGASGGF
ncbi:unnamed protein product, partial [Choristocarpus tenellus]